MLKIPKNIMDSMDSLKKAFDAKQKIKSDILRLTGDSIPKKVRAAQDALSKFVGMDSRRVTVEQIKERVKRGDWELMQDLPTRNGGAVEIRNTTTGKRETVSVEDIKPSGEIKKGDYVKDNYGDVYKVFGVNEPMLDVAKVMKGGFGGNAKLHIDKAHKVQKPSGMDSAKYEVVEAKRWENKKTGRN